MFHPRALRRLRRSLLVAGCAAALASLALLPAAGAKTAPPKAAAKAPPPVVHGVGRKAH